MLTSAASASDTRCCSRTNLRQLLGLAEGKLLWHCEATNLSTAVINSLVTGEWPVYPRVEDINANRKEFRLPCPLDALRPSSRLRLRQHPPEEHEVQAGKALVQWVRFSSCRIRSYSTARFDQHLCLPLTKTYREAAENRFLSDFRESGPGVGGACFGELVAPRTYIW